MEGIPSKIGSKIGSLLPGFPAPHHGVRPYAILSLLGGKFALLQHAGTRRGGGAARLRSRVAGRACRIVRRIESEQT